jgi:hypothetical protein
MPGAGTVVEARVPYRQGTADIAVEQPRQANSKRFS